MATGSITTKEVILEGGQYWRRESVMIPLGSQEAMLQKYSSQSGSTIQNVNTINGKPVHLFSSKQAEVVVIPIDSLPFKSYFTLSNATTLEPLLAEGGWQRPYPGGIVMDEPFPLVPDKVGFQSFFMVYFGKNTVMPTHCYLLHLYQGEIYRLPYPNIFDDGRVCMGRNWDAEKTGGFRTLIDVSIHAYSTFLSSMMNADLVRGTTKACFSKDANTGAWKKQGPDVRPYLISTGTSWLQGFKV